MWTIVGDLVVLFLEIKAVYSQVLTLIPPLPFEFIILNESDDVAVLFQLEHFET